MFGKRVSCKILSEPPATKWAFRGLFEVWCSPGTHRSAPRTWFLPRRTPTPAAQQFPWLQVCRLCACGQIFQLRQFLSLEGCFMISALAFLFGPTMNGAAPPMPCNSLHAAIVAVNFSELRCSLQTSVVLPLLWYFGSKLRCSCSIKVFCSPP